MLVYISGSEGDCTQVDMLEVVWPSGQAQVIFGLSANQFIQVIQE